MVRKLWVLLMVCILLLAFGYPVLATSEEDFWASWQKGDYATAGAIAKELGATIPEYYSLAAICYQNIYLVKQTIFLLHHDRCSIAQNFCHALH